MKRKFKCLFWLVWCTVILMSSSVKAQSIATLDDSGRGWDCLGVWCYNYHC